MTEQKSIAIPSSRSALHPESLAQLTTICVGGTFDELVLANSEEEFIEALRKCYVLGTPTLIIGGGSNILPSDDHYAGTIIKDGRSGIFNIHHTPENTVQFSAYAGTPWDELVARAVNEHWAGLEALSGIPGSVGASPVQNIGAYGQEVSEVLRGVKTYHPASDSIVYFTKEELHLSYRNSVLKESIPAGGGSPEYIVLEVDFECQNSELSAPIGYAQLAQYLGVEVGEQLPAAKVREAVIALRASKSMVLNDADRNSYSCGSFFTNPIISAKEAETLPEGAPIYPVYHTDGPKLGQLQEDTVKTSAAWLIQHAGFAPGYGEGPAKVSFKHTLSLTNQGGATGADIRALAREIQRGVAEYCGITLVPEPVIIGGL